MYRQWHCSFVLSGEVIPTEDDYTNRTTSAKEYKPGTCGIATVKILGESSQIIDGSNAPKWRKSRFANCCKRLFPHGGCKGILGYPRNHYNSQLAKQRAAQYFVVLNHRCSRIGASELILSCITLEYQ